MQSSAANPNISNKRSTCRLQEVNGATHTQNKRQTQAHARIHTNTLPSVCVEEEPQGPRRSLLHKQKHSERTLFLNRCGKYSSSLSSTCKCFTPNPVLTADGMTEQLQKTFSVLHPVKNFKKSNNKPAWS